MLGGVGVEDRRFAGGQGGDVSRGAGGTVEGVEGGCRWYGGGVGHDVRLLNGRAVELSVSVQADLFSARNVHEVRQASLCHHVGRVCGGRI